MLSEGQALEHTFRLANASDRPLRITGTSTLVPCCSSLGALPETIPAGGSIEVPATFRTGDRVGQVRVEFSIRTDSPGRLAWVLELSVDLVSRGEIRPVESPASGSGGIHWARRVTRRRRPDQGGAEPTEVEVEAPLKASFSGPSRRRGVAGGLIEIARDVEITGPQAKVPGHHASSLVVRCADGAIFKDIIAWGLESSLKIVPPGLVLYRGGPKSTKTFEVATTGPPFQITAVVNPLSDRPAPSPGVGPMRSHRIGLELDPSRASDRAMVPIVFRTDLADQPEVSASVLILDRPDANGGAP